MKRSIVRLSFISLLVTAYGICAATTAHAYIKKIQITTRQSPAFGGYSWPIIGSDASAGNSSANFNTTITLPVARNADGSPITGPAYEYIVNGGTSYELTYAAATIDRSKATLTHRVHLNDKPEIVPSSGWQYNADGTAIGLLPAGTSFVANDIYEFSYTAKDPTVNGVGFAAVRDWNAWLRYETKDSAGTANPLAG